MGENGRRHEPLKGIIRKGLSTTGASGTDPIVPAYFVRNAAQAHQKKLTYDGPKLDPGVLPRNNELIEDLRRPIF